MFAHSKLRLIFLLMLMALGTAHAQDAFRFVVTGDGRGDDNGINAAVLTELASVIATENVQLVIFNGDLVNNGTQPQLENWVNTFMDPLLAAGISVFPCRGNHDFNITAWNNVFTGIHACPQNGPPGEENLTYYFTYQNALFIALDQYSPSHLLRVNQDWLDEVLRNNKGFPHVFVYGHVPAYSVHHTDCLASYPAERDAFWNSIGRAGARVYFCGHDHFYNHAWIMDSSKVPIHQYIVGSAGAPMYDWDGVYAEAPLVRGVTHLKSNGYVVVDVNGFNVQITFKERLAPNTFAPISDTFVYTSPLVGPGVPAAGPVAASVLVLCIVLTFAAWRVSRRRKAAAGE